MAIPSFTYSQLEGFSEQLPAGSGPLIVFGQNTYHYTLGGYDISDMFTPHRETGLAFAQISEDVFAPVPVMKYHQDQDPVRRVADRVKEQAERAGVRVMSMGTGADLYSVNGMFGGLFDGPKSKREAALQFCRNWIDIAGDEFETGLIAGQAEDQKPLKRFTPKGLAL